MGEKSQLWGPLGLFLYEISNGDDGQWTISYGDTKDAVMNGFENDIIFVDRENPFDYWRNGQYISGETSKWITYAELWYGLTKEEIA